MADESVIPERSYGCSMACGNPYDFIVITVTGAETMFLCFPCYVRNAMDGLKAILETNDPTVQAMLAEVPDAEQVPMNSGHVRRRGKNAPADAESNALIEAFDAYLTPEEVNEQLGIGTHGSDG